MKEPGKSKNASVQTLTFSQRLLVLVLVGLTLAVVFGAVVGGADSSEVAHMHALATRDALDWGGP